MNLQSIRVHLMADVFLSRQQGPDGVDDGSGALNGLGHQWDTTRGNIAVKNLLMATYGNSGRTWTMEGYASSDRPGQNWLKFVANNTVKTRMIRCIKTPVEYIY